MRSRTIQIVIITLLALTTLGISQDQDEIISVSVKDAKLSHVLKILSEKSGLKFISDPAISSKLITLDIKEVRALEALDILTELYNLGFKQLSTTGKYVVADRNDMEIQTELGYHLCEFSRADDLASTLERFMTPGVGTIFSDPRTNVLVFQDDPSRLNMIKSLIGKLDQPARQIFIKGAIAEVSLTDENERGIQWFTKEKNIVSGTNFGLGVNPLELPDAPSLPDFSSGLGIGILDGNIDLAISMLAKVNDLNLLSMPYITTLDNQEAIIEVGDQIPYPKLNEFGVTSYEFKDATIRLKITPHINNDSTITVILEPQANFQQGFTPDNIPIIAKRRASSQVVVANGKTLVLGGLMRESNVDNISKVPILGSIPFIGELFRFKRTTRQKTELVVMLTPTIVTGKDSEINMGYLERLPKNIKDQIQ